MENPTKMDDLGVPLSQMISGNLQLVQLVQVLPKVLQDKVRCLHCFLLSAAHYLSERKREGERGRESERGCIMGQTHPDKHYQANVEILL